MRIFELERFLKFRIPSIRETDQKSTQSLLAQFTTIFNWNQQEYAIL